MEHTTRELSQKLHDAGFRGEHESVWATYNNKEFEFRHKNTIKGGIPAYTFSELWRVLPEKIKFTPLISGLRLSAKKYMTADGEVLTRVVYGNDGHPASMHASPAEAVGLLLLWLIEQGLFATGGE